LVEKRIHELKTELHAIEARKERLVRSRSGRMTVSLVGYTNAGKSTLMNTLTGAGVRAEDRLFATLDTRTRRWNLPNWGPVLLSDTVGFIRDLPHRLVTSFKATLEEARQADLLLHVADASSPDVLQQIAAVYSVLHELEIDEKDTLLVLNKVDAVTNSSDLDALRLRYPNAVTISAQTGEGLDALSRKVSEALTASFRNVVIETEISNGKLAAFIAAHGDVISKQFTDEKMIIHCRLPQKHLGTISPEQATIKDWIPAKTPGSDD
jgi:GTP-binding protein HflX